MDNKLTAIPESIQLLKYLRTLDLQNNRLKRLHEFFATLVSLDELKIAGNENIKGIQQETIKLGDSEVIATVQQLPKIIDKSWRTKLMVVGAGAVRIFTPMVVYESFYSSLTLTHSLTHSLKSCQSSVANRVSLIDCMSASTRTSSPRRMMYLNQQQVSVSWS